VLNSHKIRSTARLRAFVAFVTVLLLSVLVVAPALTQDTPGEDEIRNPEAEEASLPIIFRTGFSQEHLDSNIWAYDIRGAAVVREDPEARGDEVNLVLQLGHEEDWSSIVFERGHDWRNYIVEVDVKLLNVVEDADNFFLGVRYDRNVGEYALSLNVAAQFARLSSTIDGLWVGSLHQEPLTLHIDTWYRLKAHVEGGLIRFYVDDRFIGFIDDVEITRGSIRMLTPPDSFVHVDNLIVREIQSSPEPDDLLITEFMFREDGLQWFEILNDSDRHIKLDGMTITNGSETYVVSRTSLVMPPGSYKVFASENTTPYFTLDSQPYIYGDSLRFPADDGYLGLSVNDQVVTEIEYSEDTGWPLQDNVSVALHPDYLSRRRQGNGFNWCPSVQRLSDADGAVVRATPGEIQSSMCPRAAGS
jgi:hypothetical protein